MLRIVLIILQFVSAASIIGLVLIQRGKGADAGAGFGAGASGTVFGARGASTALSRATAIFAAVFMVNSLALAYTGTRKAEQPKTIIDMAGQTLPVPQAPAAVPQALTGVPAAGTPVPGAGSSAVAPAVGTAAPAGSAPAQ